MGIFFFFSFGASWILQRWRSSALIIVELEILVFMYIRPEMRLHK